MCWHKWSQWADVRKGITGNDGGICLLDKDIPTPTVTADKPDIGGDYFIEQIRRCSRCGIAQARTVTA